MDVFSGYSVAGADAKLTESLKDVWGKYDEAKAVLQRIDHRIQQHEAPTSSELNSSLKEKAQSLSSIKNSMQVSKSYGHKVGFKEPLVSYHEKHDPKSSILGSSQTGKYPEASTLSYSARDFNTTDYDSLRVSLRGFDPSAENPRLYPDSSTLTKTPNQHDIIDTAPIAESPKDQLVPIRELNTDTYFEPSGKLVKPGKNLPTAGVAQTIVNPFSVDTYKHSGVELQMPKKRYDAAKQKKKLEENSEGLAKLKETIRKQKENRSPSSLHGTPGLKFYHKDDDPIAPIPYNMDFPKPRVRKIAAGPAAPKYKGFNTAETRLRTPDGKVWKEDGTISMQPKAQQPHRKTKAALFQEGSSRSKSLERTSTNKQGTKGKATRKIGKIKSDKPSHRKTLITPSSWREGQKVAEAILGSIPKHKKTLPSNIALHSPPTKDVTRKTTKDAHPESAPLSCNNNNATASAATNKPNVGQEISAILNHGDSKPEKENADIDLQSPDALAIEEQEATLSVNMKEMLSDLRSSDSSSSDSDTEVEKLNKDQKTPKKSQKINKKRKPTSVKQTQKENSEPVRKVRHYDQSQVQKFMAKQKAERRKKEAELKKQEKEANERKMQQLNNLDKRQKEARKKTVQDDGKMKSSLQSTFTKIPPSGFNSSRSANADLAGIGYESRVASFLDKLDRYRHIKQSDEGDEVQLQPGGTKVSAFMSKLDQYLTEDTARNSQSKTRYSPQDDDNDDGDLTVADLSNDKRLSPLRNSSPSPRQSSPRLTAVASYSDKPDYHHMDRIAALKAKSDLLQERIDKQAKCLLEKPVDNFASLSHYTPYENQLKSPHRSQQSSGHFESSSTHSVDQQNQFELETSIPGVSNLRDHVAATERQRVENQASTTIQKAYKGYAVRHALETWELPSGNSLLKKSKTEELHSTSSSLTSKSSESSARSVEEIMDSLTGKDFCADDERKTTWADKMKDDEKHKLSDGQDVLQDLKSRLRPKTAPANAQRHSDLPEFSSGEQSKPPWQRSHGDKYSIPNLFAHKYLKALNRQQKGEIPSGTDLDHKHPNDLPYSSPIKKHNLSHTNPKQYSLDDNLQTSLPVQYKSDEYDNDFQSLTSTESSINVPGEDGTSSIKTSSASQKSDSPSLNSSQSETGVKVPDKQLRNSAELITWSKSLRQDAVKFQSAPAENPEDGSEIEVSTQTNLPPVNFPAPSQGSPKYSPAVLEHKMALELNRYESIDEAIKQLGGTEQMQSVALAQQETVSLAQILQSRQLQHQLEVDRLTLKAKEEALEAARQIEKQEMERKIKEAKDKEENAQKQSDMALKLQEETLKSLKAQQKVTEASHRLFSPHKKSYKADDYTTSSEKSYTSSSETSTKTPGTDQSYSSSTFNSFSQSQEIKLPAKSSVHRSPPSIVSEHSTTSVRQSDDDISIPEQIRGQKLPFSSSESKSISENIEVKGFDETDRSISEEIPTSGKSKFKKTDDKTKKDAQKSSHDVSDVGSVTFDESVTEDEIAEISRRAILPSESHRRMQRRKSPSIKPPKEVDLYDHSNLSVSSDDTLPSQAGKGRLSGLEESFSGPTSLFGDSDIGSFSTFLNATVQQYMLEQEVRVRHQSVMLKLREKAIKEKTQAELAWLEQQKQHVRRKGEDDKMPPIKKKKRAILLRLQVETEEIKKLRAANKAALQDRELIMKQHKDISRIMHSTQQIKEKLKSGSSAKAGADSKGKVSLSPDPHITSSTPVPQPVDSASVSEDESSIPNSDMDTSASNRLLRHLKLVSGGLDDRRLTYREKGLLKRKKDAERLLEWKRKLDEEEQKVIDIEKKAISAWAKEASPEKSTVGKSTKDDASKAIPASTERQSSVSPSESSIAEEVVTRGIEDGSTTTSSSVHEDNKPAGSQDLSSEGTIGDDYSQSFESSVQSVGKTASNLDQPSSALSKDGTSSKKQSKPNSSSSPGPTTPLLGHKKTSTSVRIPKKRDIFDSGSDESFSQTQSETEQSDVECRVHVLQEELKRRQLIAEKLKKQQKKKRKEHLRAQEASLKSQIEAYDALIKKTKQELTQELDVSGVVTGSNGTNLTSHALVAKPQIRSPRKSDQARQANRSRKYVIPVQSPEASPRAGSQKTVGPSSIITKQRSDSDSSGRSSRSLSFDDDQQHSPEDAVNGSKPFIHPLPFANRSTDKMLHSSAESSPTSTVTQERPNKLELFGAKLAPLPTTPITSPLPSLSKQTTPDKSTSSIKSLIPKPSKLQSPKQKTPSSSPDVSHVDDTSKSSSVFKSSIPIPVKTSGPETMKNDSPTTTPPSGGYADDFEPSSAGTDDDVSENISDHSTDKSDMSVPLMDLSTPISTKKLDLSDEDDEKTPVASPSTTPTPSPPNTPTPQNPNIMLHHDEIEGVDVMDGSAYIMDVRKHDVIKTEPASFGKEQLAEKVSEDILRSLVEESMNIAINARSLAGSRDVEENRRKQKNSEAVTTTDTSKRARRNEPSSELTPSARNLLQILTDEGDENVGSRAEPTSKERDRDDVSSGITDNLLSETINEVLEIRKQRAKKWAEASFPRDYENGNEVESIMQVDGKKRVLTPNVGTGLESEDVDREPTIARPVSPIFGSGQDDVSEEWFDDDIGITPYQPQKRDDSPIVNLNEDWLAEDVVIGPPPIKLAVPATRDDVMHIVNQAIDFFHDKQTRGEMQESFSIPEEYLEDTDVIIDSDQPEAAKSASRVFKKCIFELVWELMTEAYGSSPTMKSHSTSPWIKMRRRKRPTFCKSVPKSKKEILAAVSGEVNKLFNFSGVRRKLDPRLTLKWGTMKKKDNVDLLLIEELREEEPDWTDYDVDETTVKMQLADNVMEFLLRDTIQCLNKIEQKNTKK
uniref:Centrosome-associated protein 350 n=1 Tax=Phallusia mammillata TaxID=59560 RepID=A0A6F9D9U0_9ASCI|nr:centrosome-associated protein 350 [Phallusia mammillata]